MQRDARRPTAARAALLAALIALGTAARADDGRFAAAQVSRVTTASAASGDIALVEKTHQLSLGLHRFGNADASLDLGLEYQYTRYEYDNLDSRNRDLHRLQVPLRWRLPGERWRFAGVVAPGLATSSNVLRNPADRLTGDDLLLTARAEGRYGRGDRVPYVGLAYDRFFGRPAWYPVAGIDIAAGPRWQLRVGLPDPSVTFRLSERQSLNASAYPAGSQWHVVTDDLSDEFLYRVEAYRGRVTWSLRLAGVVVDAFAGLEFERRHRLDDATGADVRLRVKDQWVFGVALRSTSAPLRFVHGYRR
ncbi:MAG: hypothetical protein AAGD86_06590 [Pseudomonadota bacterium]